MDSPPHAVDLAMTRMLPTLASFSLMLFAAAIALGCERILTSGARDTALQGAHAIADAVRHAAGGLGVMAGGGVTPATVREVVARTGVREVHASAKAVRASRMQRRMYASRTRSSHKSVSS